MFRKTAIFVITAALSLSSVTALSSTAADSEESKPYVNALFEDVHNLLDNFCKNGVDPGDVRVVAIPSGDDDTVCVHVRGDAIVSELVFYDEDGVKCELKFDNRFSFLNSFSEDGKMLVKEGSENSYRYVVYKYNDGKLDELSVLSVNGDDIDFDGKKLTQEEYSAAVEQLEAECNESLNEYLEDDWEIYYDYWLGYLLDNPIEGPWEDVASYMVDVYTSYFLFGSGTKENATFELIDIDGDDIPELYAYAPDSSQIIQFIPGTLENGIMYSAFKDEKPIGFKDNGEIVCVETNDDGEKMYYSDKMEDDYLETVQFLVIKDGVYYNGEEEVTKEEYEKLCKELNDKVTHYFGENEMSYSEIMEYLKKSKESHTETTTTTTTTSATTTTTTSATSNTTSKAGTSKSDSPKTGDSGVALPLLALSLAVGTAFIVKQKND